MLHTYQSPRSASGKNPLSRPPIVLARLPYAGADVSGVGHTQAPFQSSSMVTDPPVVEFAEQHYSFVDMPQATNFQSSATIEHFHKSRLPASDQVSSSPAILRHDSGHLRQETPLVDQSKDSSSSAMIHMQQQVASYSGIIVTLALLAFAALLYLTLVVPVGKPVADYQSRFEIYSSTPSDAAKTPTKRKTSAVPKTVVASRLPVDPFAIDVEKSEATTPQAVVGAAGNEEQKESLPPPRESATQHEFDIPMNLSDVESDLHQLPSLISPEEEATAVNEAVQNETSYGYPSTSVPFTDYSKLYELITPDPSSVQETQQQTNSSTVR